jgi:hypothetical protein
LLGLWLLASLLFNVPHPPVGLYIGVLAFVAGIVTIWPPDNARAKAGWFLVFGGFLVLEITTLYKQHAEDVRTADKNRADEDDRFAKVLKNQQDNFAEVLRKNQEQFHGTVSRVDHLAGLAQESLANITGEDSFPYIVPQPTDPVRLYIWNRGEHILNGVTVIIRPTDDYTNGLPFRPELQVGTLHPGWGKQINNFVIQPNLNSDKDDIYLIEMYTQSDTFDEVLHFKKSKRPGQLWAYKMWVIRRSFYNPEKHREERSGAVVMDRSKWSDE